MQAVYEIEADPILHADMVVHLSMVTLPYISNIYRKHSPISYVIKGPSNVKLLIYLLVI